MADPQQEQLPKEGSEEEQEQDADEGTAEGKSKAEKNRAKRLRKKEKEKERKAEGAANSTPAGANVRGDTGYSTQEKEKLATMFNTLKHNKDTHNFWNTQPVLQTGEEYDETTQGPIECKTVKEVRQEPYDLPEGLSWWCPDVTEEATMNQVYELLRDHYVEDDDSMFRFNYSERFLSWALMPPGYKKHWHIGIRTKDDTMVGFISGIPVRIRVGKDVKLMCEINFLCVNKLTRTKGLAPLLIQEVTRRVNLEGIWQAVYTAGIVLPTPIAKCQYWHRSLNPSKLIQINFSRIPPSFTRFAKPLEQVKKHYALPSEPKIKGLRPMVKKDHKAVRVLLEEYLSKFMICPMLTNEEIIHWFLPKDDVIYTYVVQNEEGKITDMISFYSLCSTIIGSAKYKILRAAYSYYNVANTVSWKDLMMDALILAHKCEFDVFNALDIMDNLPVFESLKFGIGDGHLQYYLYNWRFPKLKAEDVGLVLL